MMSKFKGRYHCLNEFLVLIGQCYHHPVDVVFGVCSSCYNPKTANSTTMFNEFHGAQRQESFHFNDCSKPG